MGKVQVLNHAFNVGEISKAGLARVDQARTRLAAEIQENLIPFVIGKGQFRPGTEHLESTEGDNVARMIAFPGSGEGVEDSILVMTDDTLRVVNNDVYVTRPSVTSTVTNGDFSASTGWTVTVGAGATGNINSTVSGALYMAAVARGSKVSCVRSVTTSSTGTLHALRIDVTRGPVIFRCGSSSGADDYITETTLETGLHSLAFTPSGTYYVYFETRRETGVIVDSITVESSGVMEFAAPWDETELREIRHAQSEDVMFMAHTNWQPRRIERRGDGENSWSIVLYKADTGPFTLDRTANVKLTPGATRGNTTLAADSAFFRPEHVGALFRLTHDQFSGTFRLADDLAFTNPWRIRGIIGDGGNINDRNFSFQTTGTWAGTVTMQRSIDGPDSGFTDYPYVQSGSDPDFTTNQFISHLDDSDNNNLIAWHRLGFKDGDYTSGFITIAVQYDGQGESGICRVTGYSSATSVNIEVLSDFNNSEATAEWLEGEWSDYRGWPSSVEFHDGRIWWGRKDRFWASESDNFTGFSLETEGDSRTIQRSIATGATSLIRWMMSLQRLIFGTKEAEVSARSSAFDAPLTAEEITFKNASTQGVAAISPVKIDNYGVYVQRSTKRLYKIAYSVDAQDYTSDDLTRLNEDIAADGFTTVAVQRQPDTYVWGVRSDGQVGILILEPKEEVAGWCRFIPGGGGEVEDICVLPGNDTEEDRVYLIVKRTIDSSTVRYIEKLAKYEEATGGATNKMADAFHFEVGPSSSVTAAHLANETGLIGWGTNTGTGVAGPILDLEANGSGVIALGATYTNVCVGIQYDWRWKSAKLAYGAQGGTALLQKKRVPLIGLLLENTHPDAISFGPDFTNMDPMPRVEQGTAVDTDTIHETYDEVTFPFPGGWDTDSRVCLKGSAPYPATLNALVMVVDTNEKG